MSDGWISLHRQIKEGWLWKDKPFTKGQAFIDLLLEANHQDAKVLIGNEVVVVKRGQKLWSIEGMAEAWGWSRHKVSNFLDVLQNDQKVDNKRTSKYTLITIVNYDMYQTQGHQKDIVGISLGHHRDTNNNDNNITCSSNAFAVVRQAFENNIHACITAIEAEKLLYWLNHGMDPDTMIFAIEKAVLQGKRTMAYVEGILKRWDAAGVKKKLQAEQSERDWDERKKKAKAAPKSLDGRPKFDNFEGRKYDTDKLKQQMKANSKGIGNVDDELQKALEERKQAQGRDE